MVDLMSILQNHTGGLEKNLAKEQHPPHKLPPVYAEIPELFFDQILQKFKLGRTDIIVVMFLYRKTWCHPNLHREYGIGPHFDLQNVASQLQLTMEELQSSLLRLQSYELIEIIRTGQFFVRKFFTEENDLLYGQHYENF